MSYNHFDDNLPGQTDRRIVDIISEITGNPPILSTSDGYTSVSSLPAIDDNGENIQPISTPRILNDADINSLEILTSVTDNLEHNLEYYTWWDNTRFTMKKACIDYFEFFDIDTRSHDRLTYFPFGTFIIVVTLIAVFVDDNYNYDLRRTIFNKDRENLIEMEVLYFPTRVIDNKRVWELFTSIFVHINALHLTSNVVLLVAMGLISEWRLKWWRVLLNFALSGIVSSMCFCVARMAIDPKKDIVFFGASGACYAFIPIFISITWGKLSKKEQVVVGCLLLVNILEHLLNFEGFGIFYEHMGGLIYGIFIMFLHSPSYEHTDKCVTLGFLSIVFTIFIFFILPICFGCLYI